MLQWIRSLFARDEQTIKVCVEVKVSGILHIEDKHESSPRNEQMSHVGRDTGIYHTAESALLQNGREDRSPYVEDVETLPNFSSLKGPTVKFGLEDSDYDSQDLVEENTEESENA